MQFITRLSLSALVLTLTIPSAFAKIFPDDFLFPAGTVIPVQVTITSSSDSEALYFASEIPEGRITRAQFIDAVATRLYDADAHDGCYAGLVLSELYDYNLLFNDVSLDAPYASSICLAIRNGLFRGYGDGNFRPTQMITGAEAAAVLTRAAGLAHRDSNHMKPKEAWYQPSMEAMRSVDREFTIRPADVMTGTQLKHSLCVLRQSTSELDPLNEFGGC